MSNEVYRADPIFYLSLFNYKVNAIVSEDGSDQKHIMTVMDTGVGPNLIREGCCPEEAFARIRTSAEVVDFSSASRPRMGVLGFVSVTVTAG